MNRRTAVGILAALGVAPFMVVAQPGRRVPVIGFLHPGFEASGTGPGKIMTGLLDGLRALAYVEGESIKIEPRWAQGKAEALPGLAQELVRHKVNVLVAVSPTAVRAAKAATNDVPIVALDLESDPVASGFVASLARPNGNLTGVFLDLPGLAAKWLQLIREVTPGLRRVDVLWDANTGESQLSAIKAAAQAMAVSVQVLAFRDSNEIDLVFNAKAQERSQAVVQLGSPLINLSAQRIAGMLAARKLPAISPFRSFPEAGGLMSYGPDLLATYLSLAPIISKILKGGRPGDLPIEQPSRFEMLVNLKAAQALGLIIPQAVLLRADEVIR